jgi:DNA-binding MarR family transcriptional regulator
MTRLSGISPRVTIGRNGLPVERNPDPHDRRAHLLTTTQSAKPVVQHIWRAVNKANAEALKDLAIRDLSVLVE